MYFEKKRRCCEYCHGYFLPQHHGQRFCSIICEEFYAKFAKSRQEEENRQHRAMKIWQSRWDQHLKRNVCKMCFAMSFDAEERDYCPECEEFGKLMAGEK